jgi:hypothetical protein
VKRSCFANVQIAHHLVLKHESKHLDMIVACQDNIPAYLELETGMSWMEEMELFQLSKVGEVEKRGPSHGIGVSWHARAKFEVTKSLLGQPHCTKGLVSETFPASANATNVGGVGEVLPHPCAMLFAVLLCLFAMLTRH